MTMAPLTLGPIPVTPRADWGAQPPTRTLYTIDPSQRSEHVTHYNGGPLRLAGHDTCLAAVRRIQADHIAQNWADVGYNALICPHGTVIEGRGIDAVGAHCPNHNRSGYGIQIMLGDGEHPTPAQLATARHVWEALSARSGHELTRLGHRDGVATLCPGDELQAWVRAGMPTLDPTPQESDPVTLSRPIIITDAETSAEHLVDTLEEALERLSRAVVWLRDRPVPVLADDPAAGRGATWAEELVPIARAPLALSQQIKALTDRIGAQQ